MPVVAEQLDVSKRVVATGVVRVHKQVRTHDEVIDEPLLREEVEVVRVPRNQVVAAPVAVRQEGEVLIVPVLREVLVVEKRLMLVEEVHIIRHQTTIHEPQTIPVREEQAVVTRLPVDEGLTTEATTS